MTAQRSPGGDERTLLVERGFEAYEAGDVEGVLAVLDPEVEVYAPPEMVNSGTFHGHEGWLRWTSEWNDAWEDFNQEVRKIEPVGARHVVVDIHQTARGRSSGVQTELGVSYVYEVSLGRAIYMAIFFERDRALAVAREREGL